MTRQELESYVGQRIKHVGPHSTEYGMLTRLTDRTADFTDEANGKEIHTEIYRISPAANK